MNRERPLTLARRLQGNPYPGRGIVLGRAEDGRCSVAIYFIMGRSVNSRNRVFVPEADGIRTEAFDPALLSDPSLILYHPVREYGERLIVSNGDHTDTIRAFLERGESFESALRTRCFEPDKPNWTPRISGLLEADGSYRLSILKAADAEGRECLRQFFAYTPETGLGHLIHTYVTDGDPLPGFQGEPVLVALEGGIDTLTRSVWESLDPDNRISLFVRFTDLRTHISEQRIVNRNA